MNEAWSLTGATLRLATPLLLGGLAGLFSERSGVIDVGLEGKMLVAAFAAGSVAAVTGSPVEGLLAAILAACALGLVHAYACVDLRGNQVVSGMAVNIIASGLTATLALMLFQQGGQTPALPETARFRPVWLGLSPLTLAALALVPLSSVVLARTRFGLRLRAAGEHPAALDTAGISVSRLRYAGVLIASVLCGVAGASVAIAEGAGFQRDMIAGRGYIALAAMILGHWRPWLVLLSCLGFGALDAAAIRLQGIALPVVGVVPDAAVQALPFVLTIVLLAGFVGRATPPPASGLPYVKER